MAFEATRIQSTLNGSGSVIGWRQDLTIADVVVLSLTDYRGVSTLLWEMTRPEGSVAGGAGPDPVVLGTGQTASFVVDDDATTLPRDGTYIVKCTINKGGPNETIKKTGLARLNAATIDSEPLRLIGADETNEDTFDALTTLGWVKMANRLWRKGLSGGGGGGGGGRIDVSASFSANTSNPGFGILSDGGSNKAEWFVDFGRLATANINASLGIIASTTGTDPNNNTVRLIVGSSAPGVVDGSIANEISGITGGSETDYSDIATPGAIARPVGFALVQIVGKTSGGEFPQITVRGMHGIFADQ